MLEDNFNDTLNTNWKFWGEPRPTVRKGFGDSWLDLKAADKPNLAGITSLLQINNSPGIMIEFEAQLNPGYPNYPIYFDWDPNYFYRGPDNSEPTIVHLEIQRNLILLKTPAAKLSCQETMDGRERRMYKIIFTSADEVELLIDDNDEPLCKLEMGISPTLGRISFTGTGWITRILITNAVER